MRSRTAQGDDGTTAAAHGLGAAVVHGVSARDFTDAQTALAAALASLPALAQASASADAALALNTLTTVTAASTAHDDAAQRHHRRADRC